MSTPSGGNPYVELPQHTKDEMLRTILWEAVFGSMDPAYADRTIRYLLEAGAHFANETHL